MSFLQKTSLTQYKFEMLYVSVQAPLLRMYDVLITVVVITV